MGGADDRETLARKPLDDLKAHLRLLAASAETQNAWLHPCGWTSAEPFEHIQEHSPCAPVGELAESYFDMWPLWSEVLAQVMTPAATAALDVIGDMLRGFPPAAYEDKDGTLDLPEWDQLRVVAGRALATLEAP